MLKYCAFTLLIFSTIVAIAFAAVKIDENVQNKNVERTIDLTTQLVKIQHKITLEHKSKKDVVSGAYTFVVPLEHRDQLAFIAVKDAVKKELKLAEEKIDQGVAFTVTLPSASANPVLYVETVFTKSLQPHPSQITQSERQLVRYFGSAYFYSPYKTVVQKTTVQLASKAVESYTTVKPSSQSDTVVTYGPYENVAGMISFVPIDINRMSVNWSNLIDLFIVYRICNRDNSCSLRKSDTIPNGHQFGACY